MFNLLRNQVAVLFLFIFIVQSIVSSAQIRGNYNFLDFQNKPYYFGIILAYNNSNYKIIHSKEFINNDSVLGIESIKGPGFNLGIVTNLKLGRYFDFRFLPTLSFSDRRVDYHLTSNNFHDVKQVDGVLIEMPFHLRYKSEPYNDMRVFVVGGVKYAFDVAGNSRTRQLATIIKVAPSDFAVEAGAGVQFYFPYFIFSPEIKFSQGINNILVRDPQQVYSRTIEKLLSRTITISFYFEG